MVEAKVITKAMAMKIAGSGLEYGHLKCITERSGVDGLTAVFKSKGTSSLRVTSSSKIILAVFEYFSK